MLYAGIDLSDLPRLRRCNMGEYAAAFSVSNDQVHHRRLIDCGGKKKIQQTPHLLVEMYEPRYKDYRNAVVFATLRANSEAVKGVPSLKTDDNGRRITFLQPAFTVVDWTLSFGGGMGLARKLLCLYSARIEEVTVHKDDFFTSSAVPPTHPQPHPPSVTSRSSFCLFFSALLSSSSSSSSSSTRNRHYLSHRTNREPITLLHLNSPLGTSVLALHYLDFLSLAPPNLPTPPTLFHHHTHTSPASWPRLRRKRTSSPSPSSTS